jgi:hypothetical protein
VSVASVAPSWRTESLILPAARVDRMQPLARRDFLPPLRGRLKFAQRGLSQLTAQGRIMLHIIDVSRSAKPFVIIKWASVFLLVSSIQGLISVPAILVKNLITAEAGLSDLLRSLIFFAIWGAVLDRVGQYRRC